MPAPSLRDRLRAQLADLKMPGALEALDDILRRADSGELAAGEAMSALLGSHIALRNQRRLQTAMRSARPGRPARWPGDSRDARYLSSLHRRVDELRQLLQGVSKRFQVGLTSMRAQRRNPHPG